MIKRWILTGDTHGQNRTRLEDIIHDMEITNPEDVGVIILGDAGFNFFLNKTDVRHKLSIPRGLKVYCVRGNHEERPQNLEYKIQYDTNVNGDVYIDPVNERIRYFLDGGEYLIGGYHVLVIGGAYSVDKWWRLRRAGYEADSGQDYPSPKESNWFPEECLTQEEMNAIAEKINGKAYDFVFTHTCPQSWEPVDLFLRHVDQSTVDKSMEKWMDQIKDTFTWGVWCFGHFHQDRLERPCVEQFYTTYEDLHDIWKRWWSGMLEAENPFMLYKPKSPNFNKALS